MWALVEDAETVSNKCTYTINVMYVPLIHVKLKTKACTILSLACSCLAGSAGASSSSCGRGCGCCCCCVSSWQHDDAPATLHDTLTHSNQSLTYITYRMTCGVHCAARDSCVVAFRCRETWLDNNFNLWHSPSEINTRLSRKESIRPSCLYSLLKTVLLQCLAGRKNGTERQSTIVMLANRR